MSQGQGKKQQKNAEKNGKFCDWLQCSKEYCLKRILNGEKYSPSLKAALVPPKKA